MPKILDAPFPEETAIAPKKFDELDPREIEVLAGEMSRAFKGMVNYYKEAYRQTSSEALASASQAPDPARAAAIMESDPTQVSWYDFGIVDQVNPAFPNELWGRIKRVALYELQSGHRSGTVVGGSPMEQARFMAMRYELARDWQPRNGMEEALIDQMAHAYTQYLVWMGAFVSWTNITFQKPTKYEEEWQGPRLSDAEALERAAGLADRWNRIFIRSLRALRDLRRYPVIVQNAGQVNIGDKQVNVLQQD